MPPSKRTQAPAPHYARRHTQLILVVCFSLCYSATVLLLTRSPHSLFLCDPLSPASLTDPFLKSLSHAPVSTPIATAGCDGDAGSAWHDTAISPASQGKLWTPRRLRKFPAMSLLDFNNISNSNGNTARMPHLITPRPNCALWAVVTTIFAPSRTLHQLRALPADISYTASANTNPDSTSNSRNSWCVVVVGDRKTDDDVWRQFVANRSHMHYLSVADQESPRLRAAYRLLRHVPWNHFGRKNVGYLFAVHHGARLIWDTDDDNELHAASDDDNDGDGERDRLLTLTRLYNVDDDNNDNNKRGGVREADVEMPALSILLKTGVPVIDSGHALANPYPHFRPVDAVSGDRVPRMWPRGFPLPLVKSLSPAVMGMSIINASISLSTTTTTTTTTRVGVLQSLADNDPDVDALFRLTRPLPLRFTHVSGPSLAMPLGRYTPFNAQATLWSADAFALLLLPMSVHGRVSDIWRAYIAQTVMRFVGLHVAVHGVPVVTQRRNVHSYLADFQAELPLYTHAGALVQYLQNWTPPPPPSPSLSTEMTKRTTNMDVPHIMQALVVDLYELGVVQLVDVYATQMWISDLIDIGVRFPPVVGDGGSAAAGDMHGGNEVERQQQQQTSATPPTTAAQVASVEEARRPRVALCVGDGRGLGRQSHGVGSNSTMSLSFTRQQLSVDVVAIARDIETHFANAAMTLFVVGNGSSSISASNSRTSGTALMCPSSASAPKSAVQGELTCVGVSASSVAIVHSESSQTQSGWQAHWHSSRCARAVDVRELAMDEAFDWVFSVSATTTADTDTDAGKDRDVDVQVHRLPLPEDAAMRHTAVFRERAQCPAKGGAETQAEVVFGKRMAMREFMAGPEEGMGTGLVEVVRHADMDVRCGGGAGRGGERGR